MTKKKKRQNPEIDELLARPWCYYCERDFDDLKILIHHQKAKHFKCDRCARRLNTAGGLRVHMEQVHKETLEQVENAIPGRESIDLEIFGTEGIPESEVAAHNQRIMADYARKEADRRAASGQSNGPKKPKIDISKELDPEEIRRKLEAHKKAMASGGVTPVTPVASISPGRSQSPGRFDAHAAPQASTQVTYPQAASPPPPFQQPQFAMPQQNAFSHPVNTFPPATFAPQPPNAYPTAPYAQPPYPQQPPAPYGRGPQPPYNGYQQPPTGYSVPPPYNPPLHNQYQQGPPPPHLQQQRHQPSLPQPHQIPGLPPKPNVPGLPPRPTFADPPGGFNRNAQGAPPQGQWSPPVQPRQHVFSPTGSHAPPGASFNASPYGPPGQPSHPQQFNYGPPPQQQPPPPQAYSGMQTAPTPSNATPVGPHHSPARPESTPAPETPAATNSPAEKKEEPSQPLPPKPKRETRLVYSDNEVSPEERRAALAQYQVQRVANTTVQIAA